MSTDSSTAPYIEKGKPGYRTTILALFLGSFSAFAVLYNVQPMMPVLSREFGIDATNTSLVLSVSTAMLAVGLPITGPISDAIGRKVFMVAALLAASLLTLATAFVPGWNGLLALRALCGLALSGLTAVGMAYLSEEIDPRYIGVSMGLYIGGNAIGGMSGRLISGVMVDWVSWRVAMGTMGVLALVCALLFLRLLRPSRHFQSRPLNVANLVDAYRSQFRDPGLPWLFLEGFLLTGSLVTMYNYLPFRLLQPPYNVTQTFVGLLSLAYLLGIYSSAWAGALVDRLGRPRVFWRFLALMLLGLLLTLSGPLSIMLAGLLVFTFAFFAAHSIASSWVGQRATRARGQASSLYYCCFYVGSSTAGTLGGLFWNHWQWPGVTLFIGTLLGIGLLVALRLSRLR